MREPAKSATTGEVNAAIGEDPLVRPAGRRDRRWGHRLRTALDVLVVLLVGVYFLADIRLDRIDAVADHRLRPMAGPGQDWLLVASGRPERPRADHGRRSVGIAPRRRIDMMLLLHIPHAGGKPTLIDLPRDTYASIQGHGSNTFDAAFVLGGPKLLVATVESGIGIRVDRYLELRSGTAAPVRGGLERPAHPREVVRALLDGAAGPGVLLDPLRGAPLFSTGTGIRSITVDKGDHMHHLIRLAFAMRKVADGDVVRATLPGRRSTSIAGVGPVLLLDDGKVHELAAAIAMDHPVPASLVTN